MTREEIYTAILKAFVMGWWPSDCYSPFNDDGNPSKDPNGFRNFELLQKEANSLPLDETFEATDARKLFFRLRDNGNSVRQTLVRKPTTVVVQQAAPPAVDPRTTIPHQDLFKGVDSVEKCIRHIRNGRVPATQMKEVNELLNYLREHDLRDDTVTPADDKQGMGHASSDSPIKGRTVSSQSASSAKEARELVANLKTSDIGGSFSGKGGSKMDQLVRAQSKLTSLINTLVQQRVPEQKIVEAVRSEINVLSSSSIR